MVSGRYNNINFSNTFYFFLEWRHFLKEEDTNYKMQRSSHNQPYFTYSKDNSNDT